MAAKKKVTRRKKTAASSVGLSATETAVASDAALDVLAALVAEDGGAVVGRYREPFGGTPLLIAALPIDRVEPTPYQRDPSDTHVKRLMGVIESIGRFSRKTSRSRAADPPTRSSARLSGRQRD